MSYAFSRGRGNTATGQADTADSQFLGDLNLDLEYGPTAVDRPHILTLTGSYDVPRTGGLKLSAVFRARSGTPFSLRNTTFDHDRNGSTHERVPAGGQLHRRGAGCGLAECDSYTVDYNGGRAGARGPGYAAARSARRLSHPARRRPHARRVPRHLQPDATAPTSRIRRIDQRLPATFLRLLDVSDEGPTRTAQINLRYGF